MTRLITIVGASLIFVSSVHASSADSRPASAEMLSASTEAQAGNADGLAAKVKARIDAEPTLKGSSVTVSASGSNVTLEGEVASVIERAKAGELAISTDGVRKVNNKLKLKK